MITTQYQLKEKLEEFVEACVDAYRLKTQHGNPQHKAAIKKVLKLEKEILEAVK
jgi:hypothetical protein